MTNGSSLLSILGSSNNVAVPDIVQNMYTMNVTEVADIAYKFLAKKSEPLRDPLYIVVPITVIYLLIFFTGLVGNVSTCVVISRNKSMHTATNYYLFSLAVSDLVLLTNGLPQEIYSIWYRYPYIFGEVFCILRGLAAETSTNATVLTITAFTVERYIAICHPFLSHTMSKLSRAIKLIVLIWTISLAFAIPQALQFGIVLHRGNKVCTQKLIIIQHSFEISTFLFFITPMTLITLLYALIGLRLRSSNTMKKEKSNNTFEHDERIGETSSYRCTRARKTKNQPSRRVLKMLVAVVAAFFICWAPFHVQRLVAIYGTVGSHSPISPLIHTIYVVTTYISGILYYFSTTVNPFLYHIMSAKFREAFKETFETGIQCQAQCKDRTEKNDEHSQRMSWQSRYPAVGLSGQFGPNYNDPTRKEALVTDNFRKFHTFSSRPNRMTRRRSSGGTDYVNSSSCVKSRTLSLSMSHDTICIPNTSITCCSKCALCNGFSSNEDILDNVHIHYPLRDTDSSFCYFGVRSSGCCLDRIKIKEKRPRLGYVRRAFNCLSANTVLFTKSPAIVVDNLTTFVENQTQTEAGILDMMLKTSLDDVNFGNDELSSYMEEIRRREKFDVARNRRTVE